MASEQKHGGTEECAVKGEHLKTRKCGVCTCLHSRKIVDTALFVQLHFSSEAFLDTSEPRESEKVGKAPLSAVMKNVQYMRCRCYLFGGQKPSEMSQTWKGPPSLPP